MASLASMRICWPDSGRQGNLKRSTPDPPHVQRPARLPSGFCNVRRPDNRGEGASDYLLTMRWVWCAVFPARHIPATRVASAQLLLASHGSAHQSPVCPCINYAYPFFRKKNPVFSITFILHSDPFGGSVKIFSYILPIQFPAKNSCRQGPLEIFYSVFLEVYRYDMKKTKFWHIPRYITGKNLD